MEERNIINMKRILGGDPKGKVYRLLDFSDRPRDIADPGTAVILTRPMGISGRVAKHF